MAELLGHSTPVVVSDEGDLASRYVEGDETSLSELYDAWSSVIFTSMCLSTQPNAEQVTVDSFVQLWRRRSDFVASQRSLSGWVLHVTRDLLDETGRTALDRLLLADELAGFGDPAHRIMELMLTQGLSHLQVASLLGLPAATARSEVRRSVERLRGAVDPDAPALQDLGVTHLPPETLALRAFGEQVGQAHEHALDDAHVATCLRCQDTLRELTAVVATATSIDPDEHLHPAPPEVWATLSSRLLFPSAAPLPAAVEEPTATRRGWSRRH